MKKKTTRWTTERCIEDAKSYKTRSSWAKGSASAYQAARRNGLLDKCCAHMEPRKSIDTEDTKTKPSVAAESDTVTIKVAPAPEQLIGSPFHKASIIADK